MAPYLRSSSGYIQGSYHKLSLTQEPPSRLGALTERPLTPDAGSGDPAYV